MLKTIQAMNYMDNSNMPSAINPVMPYGIISGFNKDMCYVSVTSLSLLCLSYLQCGESYPL